MDAREKILSEFMVEGHCGIVNGSESLVELIRMLTLTKAQEHCAYHNLPTMDALREGVEEACADIQRMEEEDGLTLMIDEGDCDCYNPRVLVVAGEDTECRVIVDNNQPLDGTTILLLHGAKVRIKASDYSVVRVERAKGTIVSIDRDKTAVVIM